MIRPNVAARPNDLSPALEIVARVIAIANQKGGVGKTTTAVNLSASLAAAEQRTLLIDGDPQGNATSGIGLQRDELRATVYDALIGDIPLADAIIHQVQFKHLDVAPATPDLAGAEVELVDRPDRERMMGMLVEHLELFVRGKMEVEGLGEFCCSSRPLRKGEAMHG